MPKAITHMENIIANTNAQSDSVCDRANANCFRLFATLLRVYAKRSRTCLEIESKYNLLKLLKRKCYMRESLSFRIHIRRLILVRVSPSNFLLGSTSFFKFLFFCSLDKFKENEDVVQAALKANSHDSFNLL